MPPAELKTGTYSVEGSAIGALYAKAGGFGFWVATAESGASDVTFWDSKLKPAGTDPDSGKPKFRLKEHPQGGFFVQVDEETLSERGNDMTERAVWKFRPDLKGKFLTSLAAPPKSADHFPTDNFARAVLYKDPDRNEPCSPPTQTIIEACCCDLTPLPKESIERQKMIAKYYTQETPLYHEMNAALRDDDLSAMRYYSAYIKELREVFKTDHVDQIISPFEGKVWRGITFPDPEAALQEYQAGKVFVWSAFTSMSTERDVAFRFGNVVFEVSCLPPKGAYDGAVAVYAPATVQPFSDLPDEAEILFPPNIQFKVKEIKMPGDEDYICSPLIICETVAFDSDEGLREFQTFKKLLEEAQSGAGPDATAPEERAQVIGDGYKRLFQVIDANSSGTLSKKEAKGALRKVQKALAYAGAAFPGLSVPGEGAAALRRYVDEMFAATDLDGSGTIDFEELMAFFASKHGSKEAMASSFAGMPVADWTNTKATLETLVEAFENEDFSKIPGR